MTKNGRTITRESLGIRIIERLEDFNASLRAGENVCKKYTTRKVQLNLEPAPYDPELVKETRKIMSMSQALFARFLGVSVVCRLCGHEQRSVVPVSGDEEDDLLTRLECSNCGNMTAEATHE